MSGPLRGGDFLTHTVYRYNYCTAATMTTTETVSRSVQRPFNSSTGVTDRQTDKSVHVLYSCCLTRSSPTDRQSHAW